MKSIFLRSIEGGLISLILTSLNLLLFFDVLVAKTPQIYQFVLTTGNSNAFQVREKSSPV